jgi:hypothetical protein
MLFDGTLDLKGALSPDFSAPGLSVTVRHGDAERYRGSPELPCQRRSGMRAGMHGGSTTSRWGGPVW